jgi:hypothetical protein
MSIVVAPEVAAALVRRGAVVALESTIICHGQFAPAFSFRISFHSLRHPLLASLAHQSSIRFNFMACTI